LSLQTLLSLTITASRKQTISLPEVTHLGLSQLDQTNGFICGSQKIAVVLQHGTRYQPTVEDWPISKYDRRREEQLRATQAQHAITQHKFSYQPDSAATKFPAAQNGVSQPPIPYKNAGYFSNAQYGGATPMSSHPSSTSSHMASYKGVHSSSSQSYSGNLPKAQYNAQYGGVHSSSCHSNATNVPNAQYNAQYAQHGGVQLWNPNEGGRVQQKIPPLGAIPKYPARSTFATHPEKPTLEINPLHSRVANQQKSKHTAAEFKVRSCLLLSEKWLMGPLLPTNHKAQRLLIRHPLITQPTYLWDSQE
jgi:hypothetical protein